MRKIFIKYYKPFFIAITFTLLFGTVAYAAWDNSFPTTLTDSTSTSRTYYPAMLGYGGQSLIDNGKITSSGLDTNMQIGTTNIKYMMSTDNVSCVIPNLPANGAVTASLYTGYTPLQTAFSIVLGDGGYGTVDDAAAIELGDNFTITINDIYIDTDNGTDKNIIYKPEAFKVYVSDTVAGNVTASILATEPARAPDGAGSETNVAGLAGAATHWQAMLTNDGDTSFIVDNGGGYQRDLYSTADTAVTGEIESVKITVVAKSFGGGAALKTAVNTNGIVYDGAEIATTAAYDSYSTTYYNNPQSGVAWTVAEVNAMEIGVSLNNVCRATQIFATVTYESDTTVTVTGITSGEYDVTVSADVTNLTLDIGGTSNSTALAGASVPDNDNDWVFFENNPMSYCDNVTMIINGVTQAWYEPNTMLSGATLPDRAGGDNPMTITWGENTGVEIAYGEMVSYESTSSGVGGGEGIDLPTSYMPSSWFAMGENNENLPFYPMVLSVAQQLDFPDVTEGVQTLYFIVIIGFSFVAILLVVLYTRSALFGFIGMEVILFTGSSMYIIPMWVPFAILLVGVGIMYLYRQVSY